MSHDLAVTELHSSLAAAGAVDVRPRDDLRDPRRGLSCHLAHVLPDGQPVVLPTIYGRIDDVLYVHGSGASRMLRASKDGRVCVTVTLLDGLVISRSAFHHSMNYRSVVVFGSPRVVDDAAEKDAALAAIVEHVVPGRTGGTRVPNAKELAATLVLALAIDEASAKTRTGPPRRSPTMSHSRTGAASCRSGSSRSHRCRTIWWPPVPPRRRTSRRTGVRVTRPRACPTSRSRAAAAPRSRAG
jgi:nitroimidazol reductase NimA-like FMN-containing flavoprotein (pyridoxamine 5'-phosphate oxidase superfamily)